jgi:hypothetical protein
MGWARAQGVRGARIGRRIEATMAARLAAAVRQFRRTGAGLGRGVIMGGEVDSFGCVIFVILARQCRRRRVGHRLVFKLVFEALDHRGVED